MVPEHDTVLELTWKGLGEKVGYFLKTGHKACALRGMEWVQPGLRGIHEQDDVVGVGGGAAT